MKGFKWTILVGCFADPLIPTNYEAFFGLKMEIHCFEIGWISPDEINLIAISFAEMASIAT